MMLDWLKCKLGWHDWRPILSGVLASYGPDRCTRCGKERGIPLVIGDGVLFEGSPRIYLLDSDAIKLRMPPPHEIKDGDTEGTFDYFHASITEERP